MGVAHHMYYLTWFEIGRTELMREAGVPYAEVEASGLMFPVIEAGARYRRPAVYDEEIEIRTSIAALDGPRVRFGYRVLRPRTGAVLAEGFTVHAAVGRDGRPRRVPEQLRTALARWETL